MPLAAYFMYLWWRGAAPRSPAEGDRLGLPLVQVNELARDCVHLGAEAFDLRVLGAELRRVRRARALQLVAREAAGACDELGCVDLAQPPGWQSKTRWFDGLEAASTSTRGNG